MGALYDYLNRRFHLYILNGNFSRIPGANVEQRFRILACSKQRHHAHGGVDFYDLSLLHNLQTFEISGSGASPFRLERFRIVFGDDWVYSGDINLAKEPNGYGTMVSRDSERSGFFQNGFFVKECDEHDDAVAATRHVNILYLSLEFLKGGPNAMLVKGSDIEVMEEFDRALNALIGVPNFLEYVVLETIAHAVESLHGQRLSRFKVSAKQVLSKFSFADDGVEDSANGADMLSSHATEPTIDIDIDRSCSASSSSTPVLKKQAVDPAQSAAAAPPASAPAPAPGRKPLPPLPKLNSSSAVVQQPLSAPRTSASQALADHSFYGMINPGVFCSFISLLQSWFYIKAFRNVVLMSNSQDVTLTQLNCVFRSLQNKNFGIRETDCSIKVHFLEFSVWFLCPTHIISELRFEVSMFQWVKFKDSQLRS
jgi:hypothetical protein